MVGAWSSERDVRTPHRNHLTLRTLTPNEPSAGFRFGVGRDLTGQPWWCGAPADAVAPSGRLMPRDGPVGTSRQSFGRAIRLQISVSETLSPCPKIPP